jgi:ATPase subunit of ABC transporter with duplicated ATPase domains
VVSATCLQLAKVLKSEGNVLLLDEPTNDLDVDTLRALEEALEGFPGCAVVISHDRVVPRSHRDARVGLRR